MPQTPVGKMYGQLASGGIEPIAADANGNVLTAPGIAVNAQNRFNITAATVVKVGAGVALVISIITAGSTVGAVYDGASTAGNTVANQLTALPDVAGPIFIGNGLNFDAGLVIAPGTGQVVAVSFI